MGISGRKGYVILIFFKKIMTRCIIAYTNLQLQYIKIVYAMGNQFHFG